MSEFVEKFLCNRVKGTTFQVLSISSFLLVSAVSFYVVTKRFTYDWRDQSCDATLHSKLCSDALEDQSRQLRAHFTVTITSLEPT